ncbi:MAG: FkbM family methyltransferase [Halioglobus sp.]
MPPIPIPLKIPELTSELALFVHGPRDRVISPRLREEGIWEPFETQLIMSMLEPEQVFVDVGANLGYFSVLAAACVGPSGKVFAFEPDVENYNLLRQNIEHNNFSSVIFAEMAGLSEKDEVGQLFLSDDNLGDHQVFNVGGARNSTDISLLCGSKFLRQRTPHVHFFKIDTQGSEWAVLQGLMPLLHSQLQPARILVELTPLSLRQAGASGRQLIETLAQLNQPFWIVDHIEHQLVRSSAQALATWCDNVDACAGDAGFMNILVGPGFSN